MGYIGPFYTDRYVWYSNERENTAHFSRECAGG